MSLQVKMWLLGKLQVNQHRSPTQVTMLTTLWSGIVTSLTCFSKLNVFSLRPGEDNLVYGELTQLVRHLSVPSAAVQPHKFPVCHTREWQPLSSLPPGDGQSEPRSSGGDVHGSSHSQHCWSFSQPEPSEPGAHGESQEEVEIPHRCSI